MQQWAAGVMRGVVRARRRPLAKPTWGRHSCPCSCALAPCQLPVACSSPDAAEFVLAAERGRERREKRQMRPHLACSATPARRNKGCSTIEAVRAKGLPVPPRGQLTRIS